MFGLTAAPEIAVAVPSVMPGPGVPCMNGGVLMLAQSAECR